MSEGAVPTYPGPMPRRLGTALAALAAAALVLATAGPADARIRRTGTLVVRRPVGTTSAPAASPVPPPPPPPPHAWILVDSDTGIVLDGSNQRVPMRVASTFKVLSAIVVEENLPSGSDVTVSPRAAGMPAAKMNLKAGQVWKSDDLLHALLVVSANDAAVALAEQTAGSLEAFGQMLQRTAARLGMTDPDVLRDPAGLDDEFSVGGGNLISARDLAIATRTFLSYPQLAEIVREPEYRFAGGDGNQHRLWNHDPLLRTYAGAIGVKTGYTRRAGHSLVSAASRDGRTMIAVVIGAADPSRSAAALLDRGFSTPVTTETTVAQRTSPEPGPAAGAAPAAAGPEPVGGATGATTGGPSPDAGGADGAGGARGGSASTAGRDGTAAPAASTDSAATTTTAGSGQPAGPPTSAAAPAPAGTAPAALPAGGTFDRLPAVSHGNARDLAALAQIGPHSLSTRLAGALRPPSVTRPRSGDHGNRLVGLGVLATTLPAAAILARRRTRRRRRDPPDTGAPSDPSLVSST